MVVRGNLATLSANWRGLTAAQRLGWAAFGANLSRTDTLGQTYDLTGQQAYVSVNRNLNTYGAASIPDAPTYAPPASLLTLGLTASGTVPAMSVTYTTTPLAANTKMAIFATRPVSAGINFMPRGAYKLVLVTAAAAASPANPKTGYEAIFGALGAGTVGKKIFIRAVVISSTGLATPFGEASVIVT